MRANADGEISGTRDFRKYGKKKEEKEREKKQIKASIGHAVNYVELRGTYDIYIYAPVR